MTYDLKESVSLGHWPVAILAGGLATRLQPITEHVPKSLVEVAGEPFAAHQLRLLRAAGFRRVVFCVGYLGEQIEAFAGDGSRFGLEIKYVFDGETLRGTGGALKHASPYLGDQFAVLYGDSYLPVDFRAVVAAFLKSGRPALMTVFKNDGLWDTSNLVFEKGEIRVYNKRTPSPKMHYIDYGLAILNARVLQMCHAQEPFDLSDLYSQLVTEGLMAGYRVHDRFYEIGSPVGVKELDQFLREQSAIASS
jgi:NDP-sugar pyrophosphorylase family protein